MTDRINHEQAARELLGERWDLKPSQEAWEDVVRALVHSQLALMEQQRIANLIALCGSDVEVNMLGSSVSYQALGVAEKVGTPENGFIRWRLNPDIAAALGLEGDPS